jgi:hypothetical protein
MPQLDSVLFGTLLSSVLVVSALWLLLSTEALLAAVLLRRSRRL